MFSRASRFPTAKDNGIPGPGAYDPRSPESKKRGAFLEKEERFKEHKGDGIDNFGLYGQLDGDLDQLKKSRGRAVSMSQRNDDAKHRLEALRTQLTNQHMKEVKQLESQLARQTRQIEALQEATQELNQLKKDSKLAQTRQASVEAELVHTKEHLLLLPSLKKNFEALISEHAASKNRHSTSLASLQANLGDLEKKAKRSQAEEARLNAENLAKTREVGRLGDELGKVRSEMGKVQEALNRKERECAAETSAKEQLQTEIETQHRHLENFEALSGRQASTLCKQASATLAMQTKTHSHKLSASQTEGLAARYEALRAERKVNEKQDQVSQLVELVMLLEEEKAFALEQLEDAHEEIEERELRRLQDANLTKNAMVSMAARIAESEEDVRAMNAMLAQERREWSAHQELLDSGLQEAKEKNEELECVEKEIIQLSLEKTEMEHELLSTRDELEAAHKVASERDQHIEQTETALAASQEETSILQEQLLAGQNEVRALAADIQAERMDREAVAILHAQSQVQVDRLSEELSDLNNDLIDYVALQETHEELCKTIDRLMRTSSLAQGDADELARINAELVGHNNPSQKIRHLDRLRTDLAEIKKKHVLTLAELKSARTQISALQTEVAAYRSIDAVPAVKHLQASRLGASRAVLATAGMTHPNVRAGNEGLKPPTLGQKGTMRVAGRMSVSEFR